jgi:uncharacterized membrane protein YhdT
MFHDADALNFAVMRVCAVIVTLVAILGTTIWLIAAASIKAQGRGERGFPQWPEKSCRLP